MYIQSQIKGGGKWTIAQGPKKILRAYSFSTVIDTGTIKINDFNKNVLVNNYLYNCL